MKKKYFFFSIAFLVLYLNAYSQSDIDTSRNFMRTTNELELAGTLLNPIAHLINIQYQNNFEFKVGPQDGFRYTLNIQPLIPFHLGKNWAIITRTIIPVISQIGASDPSGRTGISDIVFNTYLSPKNIPFVFGIGPSFLIPIATGSSFGSNRWAAGPTIALLKQFGAFRIAAIPHHLWAGSNDENKKNINTTLIRAYITYVSKTKTTLGLFSEEIRDWNVPKWNIGITPTIGQLTKLANHYVDLSIGIKYYIISPEGAPQWGIRFTIVEVIPTKTLREMMRK